VTELEVVRCAGSAHPRRHPPAVDNVDVTVGPAPRKRAVARASGSVRDLAVIIGAVMIIDGVTELLLAIDAKRHGGRGVVPLVASS
jgi:hypothetical protein